MSYKYECDYCENTLCPETCPEAVVGYQSYLAYRNDDPSEDDVVFYEGVV